VQAELLGISRSSLYYQPRLPSAAYLDRIDALGGLVSLTPTPESLHEQYNECDKVEVRASFRPIGKRPAHTPQVPLPGEPHLWGSFDRE
jgi:hypothetical protein